MAGTARARGWRGLPWRPDAPHPTPGGGVEGDSGPGRIPELDALRGLATVAILVYHVWPNVLPAGWLAVDFFFVLSGYLITAILLRNGSGPGVLVPFFVRRGLRIWPIYLLT